MTRQLFKKFFISGRIGSGKTLLIREATLPILDKAGGFYTEEIRDENNKRTGYKLRALSGQEGVLASKNIKTGVKLNKYGLDMDVLEGIGVQALNDALNNKEIIVIDELGSMAASSLLFRETFVKCIASEKKVLATLRSGSKPYSQEINSMADSCVVELTRENYPEVKRQLKYWLER